MPECEFVGDNSAILRATNEIPGVILDERVDFISNGFLPLLAARGMIDGFLNCPGLVLVVGIATLCNLCHSGSWFFVELFVFEFRRGEGTFVRPC